MSGKNETGGTGGGNGRGLAILALSAVLGFAAVYGTMGRHDNAAKPESATVSGGAKPDGKPDEGGGAKTGQMAAFVRKKAPEAAPDIAFKDGDGKDVKLSNWKGRTVLLNLWATWCAPCRQEMPALDRLQKVMGSDKFEVVALSLDRKGAEAAKKFLDEVKAGNLKLYIDDTAKQGVPFNLVGMPTTILIDAEGREVGRLTGPAEWDSEEAKALIKGVMK